MASHTYESISGASDIDVPMEWAECPVNALTYHAFRQREAAFHPMLTSVTGGAGHPDGRPLTGSSCRAVSPVGPS